MGKLHKIKRSIRKALETRVFPVNAKNKILHIEIHRYPDYFVGVRKRYWCYSHGEGYKRFIQKWLDVYIAEVGLPD